MLSGCEGGQILGAVWFPWELCSNHAIRHKRDPALILKLELLYCEDGEFDGVMVYFYGQPLFDFGGV